MSREDTWLRKKRIQDEGLAELEAHIASYARPPSVPAYVVTRDAEIWRDDPL